ncbi:putative autophagy protein Apg12 [Pavlovales sp. CCMP2436]|nr:putative autophagy protein Apg12 [Pavlovales sp. CCMP2436]|mmetsp:Transcript_3367/g.8319  ORF Transcript_3367/g.8319 Transcript_3367/m.8319 type:complete len:135 (-) Transcript_3367:115-519(-)
MAAPHPSTQGRRGSEREAPECGYPAIAASLTCTSQLPCSRAEAMRDGKVVVTFRNVGAAPALRQNKFKIDAEQPFQAVIVFLRKQLHTADTDSLFVYVNSAFAPSPDERIADVARCFHVDGVLNLNYCTTPAWG